MQFQIRKPHIAGSADVPSALSAKREMILLTNTRACRRAADEGVRAPSIEFMLALKVHQYLRLVIIVVIGIFFRIGIDSSIDLVVC